MTDTRVELGDEIDINVPNIARVYDFRLDVPCGQMLLRDSDDYSPISDAGTLVAAGIGRRPETSELVQ